MTEPRESIINALSFDIEDWFHMVGIAAVEDPETWPSLPTIVEKYTHWILDTLSAAGVKATFFMLGWVAERYPALAQRISKDGHELGTHSYWHRKVYEMKPHEFHDDVARSIDVIESQSGKKINGFRAPSFSITKGAEWAFDVLGELGIQYDTSLFPAPRGHGGYQCAQHPHRLTKIHAGNGLHELPISVMYIGPLKIPFSGGGYMRLLPEWIIRQGFNSFHKNGWPVVVYLHPRDFAPESPRVPMPLHRRFKSYVGIRSTKRKLNSLLQRYRFDTCDRVLTMAMRKEK